MKMRGYYTLKPHNKAARNILGQISLPVDDGKPRKSIGLVV